MFKYLAIISLLLLSLSGCAGIVDSVRTPLIGFGDIVFVNEVEEKCNALTLLMKHQTGQDFTLNDKQAASVFVYKVATGNFTCKIKTRPDNGQ